MVNDEGVCPGAEGDDEQRCTEIRTGQYDQPD